MGEYFTWVNPKRREYIDDDVFDDCGFLFGYASVQPCATTDAACTLIASYWYGDPVLYMGDYWPYSRDEAPHQLLSLFDGHPFEDVLDHLKR